MATLTLNSGAAKLRVDAYKRQIGLVPDDAQRESVTTAATNPTDGTTPTATSPTDGTALASIDGKPEWLTDLRRRADEVCIIARTRWPAVFNDERPPLCIGTHKALEAALVPEGYTPGEIGYFLRGWVAQPGYLKACIAGAPRLKLDGSESIQRVLPKGAKYAADRLALIAAKRNTRRNAKPKPKDQTK